MSTRADAIPRAAPPRRGSAPAGVLRSITAWLRARETFSAALLFGGFVFVYLWPVLVGGKMLSPLSLLYGFIPWQGLQPADVAHYYNPLLSDIAQAHYPWNTLARGFIHSGTFPAWSQHAFAGTPFFANPQTVLLSPFAIPLWILPLHYAVGLIAALKLWAAAFGSYLLVRELRLGFWPGVLAGFSYALCGFMVVWLTHETLPAVAAMLPWTVWLVERVLRTRSLGAALGLAGAAAMALTGGHPGTELHVMGATALYAIVRTLTIDDAELREGARRFALVAGGIVVGAMVVAILLIPAIRSGDDTIGQQARVGGVGTEPGVQLPLEAIRTTLFPDWWGRPSDLVGGGPANYNERTFYGGAIVTILALLALVVPAMWRRKAPFVVLGVIGLAVPLHAPGLWWLAEHLPLLDNVQNQRMLLLYAFAVAILGAFGLEHLLDRRTERWRVVAVLGLGLVFGLVGLSSTSLGSHTISQAFGDVFGGARHEAAKVLVLASVGWWLVLVAGVALAVAVLFRWPARWRAVAIALTLLAAVDMLHFASGYQPMGPASKVIPPKTGAIDYLQAHNDDGRFVGFGTAIPNDWGAMYGLRDIRGYDAPQPSLRYYRMWLLLNPEQPDWTPFEPAGNLDSGALNVISLLGARYLVAQPGAAAPQGAPGLSLGYRGKDATVIVNDNAVPRATVPRKIVHVGDEDGTIATIADASFQPRSEAVVESDQPGGEAVTGAVGTAAVTQETNSTVTLRATLQSRGLVELNDAIAPGWSVTVDGRKAQALRVNDVMRGVMADAGTHTIKWSYRVPGLRLGAIVSVLGLLAAFGTGALLIVRRRRRSAA